MEITIIGSDAPVGSPEYETNVIQETTTENEKISLPSDSGKRPAFISKIKITVITLVEEDRQLQLKFHLECCIKPGRVVILIQSQMDNNSQFVPFIS